MNAVQLNINLSFQQLVEAVKQLSPKEKSKLNQIILQENLQEFELTQKMKDTLDDRLEEKDFIPAREALKKIRQKYEL
ncbi:MAG: hypothetical protein H6604_08140 [Flavobacteriales bacterium]|nr:hypothetical protein [Flavobacteriales bacterium]